MNSQAIHSFPKGSSTQAGSTQYITVSNSQRHKRATDSPYKLVSSTHCKLVGIGRIHIDCIQPHLLLLFFCHHQFPSRVEKYKSYILQKIQIVMASENKDSNAHTANKKPNRFSLGKKERSGFVCSYIGTRKKNKTHHHIYLLNATLEMEKTCSNFLVFLKKYKLKVYVSIAPHQPQLESNMMTTNH